MESLFVALASAMGSEIMTFRHRWLGWESVLDFKPADFTLQLLGERCQTWWTHPKKVQRPWHSKYTSVMEWEEFRDHLSLV